MKLNFASIFVLVLTLILIGQMTASAYSTISEQYSLEIPWEEAADEDNDNEGEEDKIFHSTSIENIDLRYFSTHHSHDKATTADMIFEIVPPPPKLV